MWSRVRLPHPALDFCASELVLWRRARISAPAHARPCIKNVSKCRCWLMGWKATGLPSTRQQRGRWVVRVDGIDTDTGKARPRQLGTYGSQRAARNAAAKAIEAGRQRTDRHTVGA